MKKLDRQVWAIQLAFVSFGVRIGIRLNDPVILAQIMPCLPRGCKSLERADVDRLYSIFVAKDRWRRNIQGLYLLFADMRNIARTQNVAIMLDAFESDVNAFIAQHARPWSFVHAGVVGWKGSAIVVPGRSFSGKTTLVSEFLRSGAEYFSDEFAAFDPDGDVHPFPRHLCVRQEAAQQRTRVTPEQLGGRLAKTAFPVKLVVITEYKKNAHWRPQTSSPGIGVLALLANSLSARRAPVRTLATFEHVVRQSHVLTGERGEASEAVGSVLEWLGERSK